MLVILAVSYLMNVLTGICGATLSMTHHEGRYAVVLSSGLVARLALGTALAAAMGLEGLAVSAAVVSVAVNWALWLAVLRAVRVNTLPTVRPSIRVLRQIRG